MRFYRLLLRCYPAQFRRRYREELESAFSEERREPRYAGVRGRLAFWTHIIGDLAASVARQRGRQFSRATVNRVPRLPRERKRTEMDTMLQDIRYAFRLFARRPGFTTVAVLSLALGIGGNTLMYGLVDGYVLNPFPFPEPDRFVAIGVTFPKISSETGYIEVLSPPEYLDIKAAKSFGHAAAFDLGNRNVSGGDVPERVFTALVLDDLFPVIGMKPALGRGFTGDELRPNGPPVAVISYRLWQSRFGGDPGILNRAIRVGSVSTSVVGVMPPGLLLIGTDLWLPWGGDPGSVPRTQRQYNVLARLAPGVTAAEANAELAAIAARVDLRERARFREYEGWRLTATPYAAALLQDLRPAAFVLLGAVGLVLLIACANLTNLLLARSTTRQRELAVRLALGAARWRIARHVLTESLLLAIAGAVVGVLIAYVGFNAAAAVIPAQLRALDLHAGLNGRVLLWSVALALAAGLLVGLLPALQATGADPHDSLKADGRAGAGRAGSRVRATLVVAEIALSVVLLFGAGLLMRSFLNIQRIEPGFDPDGVLTMRLTLPRDRYEGEAIVAFFDRLVERVAALPGVRAVSAASQYPPMNAFGIEFTLERGADTGTSIPTALITIASPSYFDTLRVSLRSGRAFTPADRLDAPRVAIVNGAFASRYLPGVDPVGQRVMIGEARPGTPWTTIVGVAADYRNAGATSPVRPEIFIPVRQQTAWNQLFLLVRGDASPAALLQPVRETVRSLDPEQPVYGIRTLEEALADSTFQQRVATTLIGVFAGVALVLAAVGIFGVMSYSVSARIQEMGVRVAIGAQRRDIAALVVGHVLRLTAAGLVIGVAILLGAGRVMSGLLFGVRPADPVTIVAVTLMLAVVALLAAWAPAWRASRVDPIEALRYE
jgi:putative ABC transport system permease protein